MKISVEDRIDLILGKQLKGTSEAFKVQAIKYLFKKEIKKAERKQITQVDKMNYKPKSRGYSKNKRAKEIMGLRVVSKESGVVIQMDSPYGLGYICPKCKNKDMEWSEYRGFVWCQDCNLDIPSCLCVKGLKKATDIFLDIIESRDKIKT